MKAYRPELVLISAGFDSRIDDLLGRFTLTDDDFTDLTRAVMEIADAYAGGRVVSTARRRIQLERPARRPRRACARRGTLSGFTWSAGRHGPEIDAAAVDDLFALGLPIAHIEAVRDDPRAGLQLLQQLRLEALVDVGKQVERDDGGVRDVRFEQVVLLELDLVFDVGAFGVGARLLNPLGIDIHADALRAVVFRGRDDDAAIAAAEIVDGVARFDAGEFQHAVDHRIGAGT